MGLGKYVVERLFTLIPVFFGILLLVFIVPRLIVPNPARLWAGAKVSEETVHEIAKRYHLNEPLHVQFYYYLVNLIQGDWGVSPPTGVPVFYSIQQYLPATIELTIVSMAIAMIIGVPLGVIGAINQNKSVDHATRVFSLVGVASPPYLVGLAVQLIFFYYLGILPTSGGRLPANVDPPLRITGLHIVDSIVTGNLTTLIGSLQCILLPAFSLAYLFIGICSRITRSAMLEILNMDYIRMAKAKGLSKNVVLFKHALRNAFQPVVSVMSVLFAYTLGGTVIIENIFSWPGIGRYASRAAFEFDYPAIQGTTIVFGIMVFIVNLLTDLIYAFLDPRIRLE